MLETFLDTLVSQEGVNSDEFEVVVIDNNSRDDTEAVVDRRISDLPIRYLLESKQGSSQARNRAMEEAHGDWLIFADDDVLLDPDWLVAYLDALRAHPDAKYAGGRITPNWIDGAPSWFQGAHLDMMDGLMGWYDLGLETRRYSTNDPKPYGASFAVHRSLVEMVGLFRTDLGTGGAGAGFGEETDFIRRAEELGAKGLYVGQAHCLHRIERQRFTLRALYRFGVLKGRSLKLMSGRTVSGSRLKSLFFLLRGLRQLLIGRGDRFRQCIIHAGVESGMRESPADASG